MQDVILINGRHSRLLDRMPIAIHLLLKNRSLFPSEHGATLV